jgi:hypothetical protein
MPYLTPARRLALMDNAIEIENLTPGDLNYLITVLCHKYFEAHHNYQGANDVVGVLECAKAEFYRRKVAPYEDEKLKSNGDI